MRSFLACICLLFISASIFSQQKLSKKELREQRKIIKQQEKHLKLIESVKDSAWGYFPYRITSSKKSGDDGGMFTLSNKRITLFNIFIPDAKNTDGQKRISAYDAKVLEYGYKIDAIENIQVSLIFEYEGTNYSFILEKPKEEKWATLKLFQNGRMLATYHGPLKD
jgi:hypothetical protein